MVSNYSCEPEQAVMGGMSSTVSTTGSSFLGLYKLPQISYGTKDPALRENAWFSSLYQISACSSDLPLRMIHLMKHFHCVWISLLVANDIQRKTFAMVLTEEMTKNDICVAHVKRVDELFTENTLQTECDHRQINTSSANVVAVYGDAFSLLTIVYCMDKSPVLGKIVQLHFRPGTLGPCDKNGTLESRPLDIWDMNLSHHCSNVCSAVYAIAHTLHQEIWAAKDMETSRDGPRRVPHPWQPHSSLRNAEVHTSARERVHLGDNSWNDSKVWVKVVEFMPHAPAGQYFIISEEGIMWDGPFSQQCGPGLQGHRVGGQNEAMVVNQTPSSFACVCSLVQVGIYPPTPRQQELPASIQEKTREGKASCCYNCLPCAKGEFNNQIVRWLLRIMLPDLDQCIRCPKDEFPNPQRDQRSLKVVVFLSYKETLGMVLVFLVLCFSLLTSLVLGVFVHHRDTPIVKAKNCGLSYTLLMALQLGCLSSLTFISYHGPATCLLQWMAFEITFSVAISVVLAKTVTVILAFRATGLVSRMRTWLEPRAPFSIIWACFLSQVGIHMVWLWTSPRILT
ncbi:vomeronasal type-2 receptor 26-like [Tachyglossus aculeatus]|uniref:vomeronasal type-2 receptor 26-like n=1 Tax=Tachyglossus aculeatus TaxID=9261 RepID=UPI0018F73EA9|nr:vomeronasal type-2 receptor 26-like [Tachyglossus aculeatus]